MEERRGLDDPSGKDDEAFRFTIREIHRHILELKEKLR